MTGGNTERHIISPLLAAFCVLLVVVVGPGLAQPAPQAGPAWPQPDADSLPPGPQKDVVLYGRRLITETAGLVGPEVADKAMRYAGNNLACQDCHLDAARKRFALPLIGVAAAFPAYMARENETRTLADRINGCFERSMNGRALPGDGREMKALIAYIEFLGRDMPKGLSGRSVPPLPLLSRAADPKHGEELYQTSCASCHQSNGLGVRSGVTGDAGGYQIPPLWGADSFNDGAGMHRLIASAGFIHANMPFGTSYDAPVLSDADAWDIAAYVNGRPRPHRAGLDKDYPDRSRKPADAPFPPFADAFALTQHVLGPFQPILDAQKAAAAAAK